MSKVSIFKFWKQAWPKIRVAMILTTAGEAQNVGMGPNYPYQLSKDFGKKHHKVLNKYRLAPY